jgi:bacillithiol biosynthesis deacetylase BshB1
VADLLAIMAHPDDAELLCGGALIQAADQGYTTAVLDLTKGEAGSYGDPDGRAAEALAAARILGLASRENAGLPDGALTNTPETRALVAAFIRRLRPRTVILQWPEARHPDHRAASELGKDACFLAGLRNAPIEGEPHRPSKVVYSLTYQEATIKPTFVLDITDQIDRKLDAIFAFASQFAGRSALGDVFGGGDRAFRDQVRTHAAHYGSLIRRPFGEPYWTRETMLVSDLVKLPVNSI